MGKLTHYGMIPRQGAIPDGIWKNPHLQEYIHSGGVFGYVGHEDRTIRTDKIVIRAWKSLGMNDVQIAEGLTWGSARHMTDDFSFHKRDDNKVYEIARSAGVYLMEKGVGSDYKN